MSIISLQDVTLSYGGPPLLDHVSLQIEKGERIGLLGRNGTGKSTLMRLVAGEILPDQGNVITARGTRIARLPQEVPPGLAGSILDVVADGLGETGKLLSRFQRESHHLSRGEGDLARLEAIQHTLESSGGWQARQQVEALLTRLNLDPDLPFSALSGGFKRRVLLGRALVGEPELLLLDEPTNHLDLGAVEWLEGFLASWPGALLFVSHDRVFLDRLATRIIELDRGILSGWPGGYADYLRYKAQSLADQEAENNRFDKRLAEEEVWIRTGIKARRTRNEGRVRALEEMRRKRQMRREQSGKVKISVEAGPATGKRVFEVENISFSWEGKVILKDFSTTILKGDKVGIMGANGCGKTTLLALLLGHLAPLSGSVTQGSNLEVSYFDQMRDQLDDEKSVLYNVADGNDRVTVDGRTRHVISYLKDFLFTPDRSQSMVKSLSGGERARLLLARLFTRPANVLVLDEPTNDLDVETLEILESLVVDFPGVVLLVSHDRAFMDNVVTSLLVFDGEQRVEEVVGGWSDWQRQRAAPPVAEEKPRPVPVAKAAVKEKVRRLTYKERLELEALPARIESLEAESAALQAALADSRAFLAQGGNIAKAGQRLEELEAEAAMAYARWELLEGVGSGGGAPA